MPRGFRNDGSKLGFKLGHHLNKGVPYVCKNPLERARKISIALKGRSFSEEHKAKLRVPKSKEWIANWLMSRKSKNNFKHTEHWKKQHSSKMLGKNNPMWKGGKSFEPYPLGWTKTYKEQIRFRDNYKCRLCGMPEIESDVKLNVHHIDYNKKNILESNLASLCKSCHMKTNYNRQHWIGVFTKK